MVETTPELIFRIIVFLLIPGAILTFLGAFLIRLFCKLFFKFTPRYWRCFRVSLLATIVIFVICCFIEAVADAPIIDMKEYEARRKVVAIIHTIVVIFVGGWIIGFRVKKPDSSSLGFWRGIVVALLNFLIFFAVLFIYNELSMFTINWLTLK